MANSSAPLRRPLSPIALLTRLCGLVAVVFITTEIFWRLVGWGPVTDDVQRWMTIRAQVNNDSKAIALIGSSRVLCGLDPEVLNDKLPGYRAYSLAISGSDPLPVLEDLARDPAFRGTVVCENGEAQGFERYPFKQIPSQLKWSQLPIADGPRNLIHWTTAQVTSRRNSLWSLMNMTPPKGPQVDPRWPTQQTSRFLPVSFTPGQATLLRRRYRAGLLERYRAWKQQPTYTRDQSVLAQIPKWVAKIRARGGDVIFVRMPTDGEIRRLSLELYRQHTKEFASRFTPYIDCENEPELRGYPSADESHLDGTAAREFSAAFARTLLERDLIGRGTLNAAVR